MERRRAPVEILLDRALERPGLNEPDRRLVTELVRGVLRHRGRLDWAIGQCSKQPIEKMSRARLNLLRLGAYQLLFLDKIPAAAAIHQAVELAKQLREREVPEERRAAVPGFVNAVLRAIERAKEGLQPPDLLTHPVEYLTIAYSHPAWLIKRWLKRYGAARTARLCRANNEIPPLTLRVNRLKVDREHAALFLQEEGVPTTPCAVSPDGLTVLSRERIPNLPGFDRGWFYVQDEAAQLVARAVGPQPGERVLDACAAPGGKSTHLAELMRDRGEVVALDPDTKRLDLIRENTRRLGISIVHPVAADAASPESLNRLGKEPFDRVLVDAPCSGLGVLRRHPEAKWDRTAADLRRNQAQQLQILNAVAPLLRRGGVLVYSTCSTEPEENEQVIQRIVGRTFHLQPLSSYLPEAAAPVIAPDGMVNTTFNPWGMDHFYIARLEKIA